MPGPDLHVHSTASDGALTPSALVALAERLGLPAIAMTDHDTVAGVGEALEAASSSPVTVIAGVELSAGFGSRSVHILGYHIDHTDPALLSRLAELREVRLERARRIVETLADGGITIALGDVMDLADGGAIGRAHIAQLLVAAGHAESVPHAFAKLLGSSAPYYVPKPVASPQKVIGWIEAAGGVAVLAHPALSKADDLVQGLVAAGIVGIEAYHGAHDAETRSRYQRLADAHGLITTGGSDFHGAGHEGGDLGSAEVPPEAVAALAAAKFERHAYR